MPVHFDTHYKDYRNKGHNIWVSISGESQIKVFPQICKHYENLAELELLITLVLKEQYSILYNSKFGAGGEGGFTTIGTGKMRTAGMGCIKVRGEEGKGGLVWHQCLTHIYTFHVYEVHYCKYTSIQGKG